MMNELARAVHHAVTQDGDPAALAALNAEEKQALHAACDIRCWEADDDDPDAEADWF